METSVVAKMTLSEVQSVLLGKLREIATGSNFNGLTPKICTATDSKDKPAAIITMDSKVFRDAIIEKARQALNIKQGSATIQFTFAGDTISEATITFRT